VSAPPADRPALTDADLRLLDATSAPAALRLVREGSWALAVLGVVALSVVFVLLGRWQWHRHEAKVERRDQVAARYDSVPVPLTAVLATPQSPLPADRRWTPVRVAGTYDATGTLLVRNRPYDGEYGFEVLVPLRLAGGGTLVVDRGWVPFGESATALPAVPEPPGGTVEVVVRLRPGEPSDGRRPPAGQLQRIDLAQVSAAVGRPVHQAYGVLAAEQPRPPDAPALLPRPDTGLGPHLAYAYNWWGFAVAAYGLLGYYALREVQNRRLRARGVSPEQAAAARRLRSRRRKVRDEDWEDAAGGT
jgi:cytochrome oxidase assembly protein ShyY1